MEQKKNNLINIFTGAFDKFVQTFKKHGVVTVTYIMLLFLLFYAFILNPININSIVEKAFVKNQKEVEQAKSDAALQRMKADELLVPVMEEIAERDDVSRVLLLEKHNNSQNISGIDFLYLSSTYETIDPTDLSLDYIGDSFQKQYVTNFLGSEIIGLLSHKEYLYYSHIEECQHTSHRLLHKLSKFGAKSLMLIPFRNGNNRPLLILCVISNKGDMDEEAIFNFVKPYIKPIKQALMK